MVVTRFIGVTFISRSAVDFASALDVIWPFFAGLLKDNHLYAQSYSKALKLVMERCDGLLNA